QHLLDDGEIARGIGRALHRNDAVVAAGSCLRFVAGVVVGGQAASPRILPSVGAGSRRTRASQCEGAVCPRQAPARAPMYDFGPVPVSHSSEASMRRSFVALAAVLALQAARAEGPLVFQSDFGTRDAAV